jgi:hypothetical protein
MSGPYVRKRDHRPAHRQGLIGPSDIMPRGIRPPVRAITPEVLTSLEHDASSFPEET